MCFLTKGSMIDGVIMSKRFSLITYQTANCNVFFVLFCFRVIFHLIVSFVLFHFNLTNLADEAKWSLNTLICRRSQVRIAIPMIELGSKINISGLNANKRKGWRPSEQNIKYGQNKNNKKI